MKYQNLSLHTNIWSMKANYFCHVIFCDGIFSCTVCVCDGMVEVNMGHDPTCSSSYAPHWAQHTWDKEQEDVYPINVNKRGVFNEENELFMIILLFIWLIKRSWGWAWKRSEMSPAQGPMCFTSSLTSVPLFKPSINCLSPSPKIIDIINIIP